MNTIVCRSPQQIEDDTITEAHTAVLRDIREMERQCCVYPMASQKQRNILRQLRNTQARIELVMLGKASYRDTFDAHGVWAEIAYAFR